MTEAPSGMRTTAVRLEVDETGRPDIRIEEVDERSLERGSAPLTGRVASHTLRRDQEPMNGASSSGRSASSAAGDRLVDDPGRRLDELRPVDAERLEIAVERGHAFEQRDERGTRGRGRQLGRPARPAAPAHVLGEPSVKGSSARLRTSRKR